CWPPSGIRVTGSCCSCSSPPPAAWRFRSVRGLLQESALPYSPPLRLRYGDPDSRSAWWSARRARAGVRATSRGSGRRATESREELARLAVSEERLRFARDLHDLLGHTLSLMVVKTEAVRRLIERDPGAAVQQAHEVEAVGRRALAEVRDAVTGYRQHGLTS